MREPTESKESSLLRCNNSVCASFLSRTMSWGACASTKGHLRLRFAWFSRSRRLLHHCASSLSMPSHLLSRNLGSPGEEFSFLAPWRVPHVPSMSCSDEAFFTHLSNHKVLEDFDPSSAVPPKQSKKSKLGNRCRRERQDDNIFLHFQGETLAPEGIQAHFMRNSIDHLCVRSSCKSASRMAAGEID